MQLIVNKELLGVMRSFNFYLIECSLKNNSMRPLFKLKEQGSLNKFAIERLFNKLSFNSVSPLIIDLCSKLSLLSVGIKESKYTTLKLYFENAVDEFKIVSGSKKKVDHIFNIINDYSLQGLCALNLNKDNESIIEKKIYFDIREEDVNKLDLNQRLLNALPELMSFLNLPESKVKKINSTIELMSNKSIKLTCFGVDVNSDEIKLYFDDGK
ncbi:hypothetical protein BSPLISOX_1939 [uncultured Gammaproteobacteria bacterium]|nr:hypothetical protein [uncultured Gammaproteobacteria bacterium]CAC9440604.1 hypothetical protein [uncultured Gammaproteobacteria bacterium]VVH65706.1 hypothetical protein BSPLISOX_1939 [uncultured Gammaproteobacteria bacterium]